MSFEQPSFSTEKHEAFDDKWYERFEKSGSFSDYSYLNGEKNFRENQKNKFISGEIENPSLDYPDLETFDFDEKETALLQLKNEIIAEEKNKVVSQVYRWKINEKLAELRMLKKTKSGDDRNVARYSKFIYGQPEKEIYEYTLSQLKTIVDQKIFSANSEINSAAKRINKELFEAFMNNESTINFGNKLSKVEVDDKSEYTAEEIKTAFESALEAHKLKNWEVIIEKEGKIKAINVNQEKKKVFIPEKRKLKALELQTLIAHEIETHVLRRENGERSKLKILGLGLDRYLKGEEGIATYKEQTIKGAEEFSGLDGHLAISLAAGLDGKKRNFRQVFEILKDYFLITSKKEGAEVLSFAQISAWNRCVRTFRGTTCQTPGACLTRDIVYREGNIGIWDVAKSNPEEIKRFSVGKYDPTNPRHIWILEQLGINDADLEDLEK
ncbi:MAG TPA: hypothetical protein DCS28_03420 [Candidatus Moranbacteria bacterium]|nr:hypothetical protein [Candidatus Moranbacteria bacterium]HAT75061.1 hypothetical protein [Candidatus Moranbacteria bacterium]